MARMIDVTDDHDLIEVFEDIMAGIKAGTTIIKSAEIMHGFEYPQQHNLRVELHAIVTHDKER